MPVMDGYEATVALRRFERENGRPPQYIVACTASGNFFFSKSFFLTNSYLIFIFRFSFLSFSLFGAIIAFPERNLLDLFFSYSRSLGRSGVLEKGSLRIFITYKLDILLSNYNFDRILKLWLATRRAASTAG